MSDVKGGSKASFSFPFQEVRELRLRVAQSLAVSTQLIRWPTTLHSPERCFKDVGLPCQAVSEGRVVVGSGREEPFPYSFKDDLLALFSLMQRKY